MVAVIDMRRADGVASPRAGSSTRTPSSARSGAGGWVRGWGLSFGGRDAPSADAAAEDNTGGGVLEELEGMFQLSYTERMYGFIGCAGLGVLLFFIAYILINMAKVKGFVVCISLGTVAMLMSTVFLLGPSQQIKRMVHPSRLIALCILVLSVVITIYAASKRKMVVAIIFAAVEVAAFFWYALSFIPFARSFFLKMVGM